MHTQIKDEVKEAMRAHDEVRLLVIRGLITAFTNELIATKRKPTDMLSDDEVMAVIRRAVKQHKDSIEQFEKGGRSDLAEGEKAELIILEKYLPAAIPREKVVEVAKAKIAELGVLDKSGIGKLTGGIMKEFKGQADGNMVKSVLEELLA